MHDLKLPSTKERLKLFGLGDPVGITNVKMPVFFFSTLFEGGKVNV